MFESFTSITSLIIGVVVGYWLRPSSGPPSQTTVNVELHSDSSSNRTSEAQYHRWYDSQPSDN